MQSNTISLASLVAGAVLFFLPWLEFQCQGKTILQQSGLQIVTGRATVGEVLAKMNPEVKSRQTGGDGIEMGFLSLASGMFLLFAAAAAWRQVREGGDDPASAGVLAGIALVLVCIQMAVGFPIERSIREGLKSRSSGATQDPLESALEKGIANGFKTRCLPAFYLYMTALAVPTMIWLGGSLAGRRRDRQTSSNPQ
jgi:hypothetical protein